jgi:asparagine synthase (glutamine-hydrolysing)
MQAQSVRPVKTFSIGFHETHYDEAKCAKRVAGHLGTDHTEFYVEPHHAIEVIPKLPDWFDEPFADASQIPTYLISELTRRHVTVALTGDGGDEVFGGYNRYYWVPRLAHLLNVMPRPLCKFWAHGLQAVRPELWDRIFGSLPSAWRPAQPGDKVHKLAKLLASPGVDAIYRRLVSQWDEPQEIVTNGIEPEGAMSDRAIAQEFPDALARMQVIDMLGYLPEDILTKVDRATMAVGLEGRVPLIDHRVVTYAWSLPPAFKVRLSGRKWLLRQVLSRYVPSALVDRPKMGFGVPIGAWLRGALREWADDLLSPARLRDYGFVSVEPVRRTWLEHLSGHRNWDHRIWTVLMLQAWRRRWA